MVLGRDGKTAAKKGDDPGPRTAEQWQVQVEVEGAAGQSAVWRRRKQPKKNAIVLSFRTGDASHEKRSQGAEAGREERSRQQQ